MEFCSKCEWEGSLWEGFEWGLSHEDLDDSDPEFREYIRKMYHIFCEWKQLEDEQLFDDMLYQDSWDE